ncbi:MAG: Lipid-A-disaccharide synthase [Gammaproteobacteria bacterium]|nr:Lipid-A-disaccharide synthase [Gammaproteobacteria bacterium]
MLRVAIVAGEPSGDLLAAGLLRALKAKSQGLAAAGIAGPRMRAQGCEAWESIDRLAVMGLPEIIRRYPELRALQRETVRRIIAMRPDVYIGVDAPEFNLGIEVEVRAAGIPTVHYVSPSVWAWREGRIRTILRGVDLMLTLFPFEARHFERYSLPVVCVGHPLVEELASAAARPRARAALEVPADTPLLALLPGSRMSELRHHAAPFLLAAAGCRRAMPALKVMVPLLTREAAASVQAVQARVAPGLAVDYVIGRSREVLAAADAALIVSGTATLEALLLDCPMVVAYRAHWLSYALIRPLIRTRRFALPNLLAEADVVPECIQRDAKPATMSARLLGLLGDAGSARRQRVGFAAIRAALPAGASGRAADAVLALRERVRENSGQ